MSTALEQASVLHLLVELMKNGRARIIPELIPIEPIEIDAIISALHRRTGVNHGHDIETWCHWFNEVYEEANEHDRQSLALIKKMVEDERFYADRLMRKRRKTEPEETESNSEPEGDG